MLKNCLAPIGTVPQLLSKINAVSEIIRNRPEPIRKYDQIYMRTGDFVRHLDILDAFISGKQAVFIGDGDAVASAICYLSSLGLLTGPKHCTVLDFDERIVQSINLFSKEHGFSSKIDACLYNVSDPLPERLLKGYDCFYTNPPYGCLLPTSFRATIYGSSVRW